MPLLLLRRPALVRVQDKRDGPVVHERLHERPPRGVGVGEGVGRVVNISAPPPPLGGRRASLPSWC